MAIKAVIFDLGNVILKFNSDRIASKLGKNTKKSAGEIYEFFFSRGFEDRYNSGKLSTDKFYLEVTESLGLDIAFEEFVRIWTESFTENTDVTRLIEKIKERGEQKLGLLSNTNDLHFNYIRDEYPVVKNFDELILSYEVGVTKPAPEIYRRALCALDVRPGEAVFIDDIADYVAAAEREGIYGIHFKNAGKLKDELARLEVKF